MAKGSSKIKGEAVRHYVRAWRKHRKMTQEEIAERLGVTHGAISQLENGKINYTQTMLEALADALDCAPWDLLDTDPANVKIEGAPLISFVSAGELAGVDTVEFYDVDAPVIRVAGLDPDGVWIALRVEGDSMDRISPPDSIILVNVADKRLAPNACYVIADADGSASYKRYRPNPERFEPVSTNPAHEPMFPDNGNMPAIVGRVRKTILDM